MTEIERMIIILMKQAGIEFEACITIMSNLKTLEQQEKMLTFLKQNPTATNKQAVSEAKKIIEKYSY